jgi:hypothetical protein
LRPKARDEENAMRTDTVWTKTDDRPLFVAALAAGTIAALLLLAAPKVEAQPGYGPGNGGGYGSQIPGDRDELRGDRMDLRGDRADARRFARLLARLDWAEQAGNRSEERRTRAQIQRFLRQELMESRRDLAGDRSEARRGRNDAGDPWDDHRDARATRARLAQEYRVVRELAVIETDVTRGSSWALERERRLLREFLRLTRQDALASGRELREDRRELWKDRQGERGRVRDEGDDRGESGSLRDDRREPIGPPDLRDDRPEDRSAPMDDRSDDRPEIQDRSEDQIGPPPPEDEDRTPPPPEGEEDSL